MMHYSLRAEVGSLLGGSDIQEEYFSIYNLLIKYIRIFMKKNSQLKTGLLRQNIDLSIIFLSIFMKVIT